MIDTATNTLAGPDIYVGSFPRAIAISPDGTRAYVTIENDGISETGEVAVIDTATNTLAGPDIAVGDRPQEAIAITPDGTRAYVANGGAGDVSVIDTATNTLAGPDITVGSHPSAIAITPDGTRAYVVNRYDDVSVINTATNTLAGPDIAVGGGPNAIAITPDGTRAYVTQLNSNVSVIDTATNTLAGPDIAVGGPNAIAITPNQTPTAALNANTLTAEVGEPVGFDASDSSDDDGIAEYRFAYGDGDVGTTQNPTRNHIYTEPGTYEATVTADDGEGCPPVSPFPGLASPFTGQTAYCNGPSTDTSEAVEITVADPDPPEFKLAFSLDRPQDSLSEITGLASCSVDCTADATGKLRLRLNGETQRFLLEPFSDLALNAETETPVSLAVPDDAQKAAAKALKQGKRVRAKVRLRAAEADGGRERSRVRLAALKSP